MLERFCRENCAWRRRCRVAARPRMQRKPDNAVSGRGSVNCGLGEECARLGRKQGAQDSDTETTITSAVWCTCGFAFNKITQPAEPLAACRSSAEHLGPRFKAKRVGHCNDPRPTTLSHHHPHNRLLLLSRPPPSPPLLSPSLHHPQACPRCFLLAVRHPPNAQSHSAPVLHSRAENLGGSCAPSDNHLKESGLAASAEHIRHPQHHLARFAACDRALA